MAKFVSVAGFMLAMTYVMSVVHSMVPPEVWPLIAIFSAFISGAGVVAISNRGAACKKEQRSLS